MKNRYLLIIIGLSISITVFSSEALAQEIYIIPQWIKNNAKWWSEGQIGDSDFIKGIQYLMQNGIMKIPALTTNTSQSNQIPKWVKNNAGWWADGTISDNDFVLGIQYLVSEGIINIQNSTNITDISNCDQLQTAADKETCIEQIQQENKLNNDIASVTPYVIGPIAFYNINNHIEPTENGKSILTIHFVVKNTDNSEITMSCQRQDSCNYALSDGQKEIPYSTNTLVYGSLTLLPNIPKYLDWTFYEGLDYQPTKNYSFLVKEPWGSGSIHLKIK
ncbi:MAG: hypothetical protein HY222_04095 [Thaumarchaeota archaeon]|nr:hypothetical protein [Nitrososphaerota archaeon]MBI3641557.1 hypothetical protein [Nitrososphaerota archaeon]